MTVSLVKRYYVAGWNMPGYLPDRDSALPLFTTLGDARAYLADELDRASDDMFATELDNARMDYTDIEQYEAHYSEAHEGSASMSGSAELIRSDRDGAIRATGEWSTIEPDGYAYWIAPATL